MSDLILPTEEQVERAARALCTVFDLDFDAAALDRHFYRRQAKASLVLLLNKDKILGEPAEAVSTYTFKNLSMGDPGYRIGVRPDGSVHKIEPSPIALTEDHIPSLERAIRAEGYDIKVDTETGEVKLYREQK